MLTRRTLIFGAACAMIAVPAFAADASASAFVTAIYNAYKGKDAKGVPLDNERIIRRYFEPTLAAAMAKDQKAAAQRNEVGLLDFDPFLNAQDWDVNAFDIAVSDAATGMAKATVKFVNQSEAPSCSISSRSRPTGAFTTSLGSTTARRKISARLLFTKKI
jgi:hypothetical protein